MISLKVDISCEDPTLLDAGRQDVLDFGVLRFGHPHVVLGLDLSLPGNIGAPETLVRRQPGRCVLSPLGSIGWTIGSQKVQWVVRALQTGFGVPSLGTLLPGVGQCDNVISVS